MFSIYLSNRLKGKEIHDCQESDEKTDTAVMSVLSS